MEVILLERVKNLGDLGETVKVRPGYGRNFLIPKGKAVPANEENKKVFEERRADLERKAQEALVTAQERQAKLEGASIVVKAHAGDEGKLFGSVGTGEIADAVTAQVIEISKSEVEMPEGPIRTVGDHEVGLILHSDVRATITVVVEPEE
jgi:large subunit ribosomal protein L9